jgi:hypothetical protein
VRFRILDFRFQVLSVNLKSAINLKSEF